MTGSRATLRRLPWIGWVSAAAGLLVALRLPWRDHGVGSAITVHRLGDLMLSGELAPLVPRWFGLAPYLLYVVAAGWLGAGACPDRLRRWLATSATGMAALLVVASSMLPSPAWDRLGPGALLAVAAVAVAGVSTAADWRLQETAEAPGDR